MKNNLSIIIPCYNCEDTLEEAVLSIYKQGLNSNFEIVMVDDKSTDGTYELMKDLSHKFKEIVIYQNETNLGGGATRNKAVQQTNGDIIFCLDSDDILPPATLIKMYEYLKLKEYDGVCFDKSTKFIGKDVNNIENIDISPFKDLIPLESILDNKIRFHPLMVNFMYTKKAFDTIGGYPTDHGFDTQGFGWIFLCNNLKAYTCPGTEYLHRVQHKASYYIRNYQDGLVNYNWRKIFLENYNVLSKQALDFIIGFNCQDFTKNLYSELKKQDFKVIDTTEKEFEIPDLTDNPVSRNSIKGIFYRLRNKIINYNFL